MSQGHQHSQEGCGCGCGCGGPARSIDLGIDWAAAPDDEMVCGCAGKTKGDIVAAIQMGAFTAPLVAVATGAGRGRERQCREEGPRGRHCGPDIEELIRLYAGAPPEKGF